MSEQFEYVKEQAVDMAKQVAGNPGDDVAEPGNRSEGAALDQEMAAQGNPVDGSVDDLDEDPQN